MSDLRVDIKTSKQKRNLLIKAVIKILISVAAVVLAVWLLTK